MAEIARDMGILTIAVVTKPFAFEGKTRMRKAESGIDELKQRVDTLVVIPNERLLQVCPKGTSFKGAFNFADDVLRQGIQGISDLISQTGIINLDFADVKAVMESGGMAHLGIGIGKGEKAMADAAQNAISSPMLETSIDGARAVLINVTCNSNCSIVDINDAVEMITAAADSEIAFFGGSLQPMAGFVRSRSSRTARSKAERQTAWHIRTMRSERPAPYCSVRRLRPFFFSRP